MTVKPGLPTVPAYALPTEDEIPASRAPWTLEPKRAALLVHDMQRYFMRPYAADAEPLTGLVANIARLIRAARAAGVPVFTRPSKGSRIVATAGCRLIFGTGHEPRARTSGHPARTGADPIRLRAGQTSLQRLPAQQSGDVDAGAGRDQLIVCGVYAHIGCQLTAAEAFQRDIEPFFVADALGDFSREKHMAAVNGPLRPAPSPCRRGAFWND